MLETRYIYFFHLYLILCERLNKEGKDNQIWNAISGLLQSDIQDHMF